MEACAILKDHHKKGRVDSTSFNTLVERMIETRAADFHQLADAVAAYAAAEAFLAAEPGASPMQPVFCVHVCAPA